MTAGTDIITSAVMAARTGDLDALRPVDVVLAGAREVRAAEPEERAAALAAVRVAELPAGLPGDQVAHFDLLRARAAWLIEVYVVSGEAGQVSLVRAADSGQLVLLLD